MYPNINAGIGALMAQSVAQFSSSSTGRFFIVCAPTDTNYAEISAMYGSGYPDGSRIVFSTIALALVACVADRGDSILVASNHDETITTAGGITVATNGVSITGLGKGIDRPTITFTTAVAASFNVTANEVTVWNIQFVCGIDAQTAMVNVTGTDVSFQSCEFDTNSGTVGAILGILTGATSDRFSCVSCRFIGPAVNTGTTTTAQIQYESAVDVLIQDCYFTGKMTQAILNTATVLRGLIRSSYFVIATGTKAIAVAAASTPFIAGNRINVPSGTTPIVAAAGFVAGNAYSAAAGVTAGTAATF